VRPELVVFESVLSVVSGVGVVERLVAESEFGEPGVVVSACCVGGADVFAGGAERCVFSSVGWGGRRVGAGRLVL
jgi:hypothetical protein